MKLRTLMTIPVMVVALWSAQASALNVGDITSFIYPSHSQLSKEIKNNTPDGRLVLIRVERISSPTEGGKVIPMSAKDELMWSPAKTIMPAQSARVVRFHYNGPKDGQERFYRIVWFNQALADSGNNNNERAAVATTSARISTILVVSPRNTDMKYSWSNGVLKNNGNASFRVTAFGQCSKDRSRRDCKEQYYVLPGKERQLTQVDTRDKQSQVGIWFDDKFIPVK